LRVVALIKLSVFHNCVKVVRFSSSRGLNIVALSSRTSDPICFW